MHFDVVIFSIRLTITQEIMIPLTVSLCFVFGCLRSLKIPHSPHASRVTISIVQSEACQECQVAGAGDNIEEARDCITQCRKAGGYYTTDTADTTDHPPLHVL